MSVLWWEYLASGNKGLTCGPETIDLTKSHDFKLYMWENVKKVG